MSLSGIHSVKSYTASASQVEFEYPYAFFADSDIKVSIQSTAGVISTPTFTVAATNGDRSQGGTITLSTGATLNDKVTISREVPITQEYDLQEGSTIDPKALNTAFDRTVAQNQQQQSENQRSVLHPIDDPNDANGTPTLSYDVPSVANRANKVLSYDNDGNVIVQSFSTVAGDAVTGGNGIDITANSISVDNSTDFTFNAGKLALATDSVDSAEIKADAVDTAEIKDNAVTTAKITDDAVTVAKIADNAVTAAQIADNAVTSSEINANAVSLAKMAQMAQNTVIGRITSGTGNPEHVPFTLKKSVSYYTKNARNSSSSTNTPNWRWGNWTEYENVGTVSDILTLSSGNYTNNDGTSITLPNSIFTFASTGTYLIEVNGVIYDSDSDSGDYYSLCLTKADSQSSDTHTNMAGTQWQTDTEMNHVAANIALSVTSFANEINNPFTLVFEMVVTDTSTDKLQVACNDEGSTRTEWDAMGKIKITKLS
jgi:hypothetical protein